MYLKLKIIGITYSQVQAGAYALILSEENGKRRIPIIIGTPEAQSIAIFLENLNPPRPLTHDLFISFVKALNAKLNQVNIYRYEDGIFSSELIFEAGEKTIRLDARTSDAIALAIRTNAAIYIAESIMNEAGILMEENDIFGDIYETEAKNTVLSIESMSMEELRVALEESITNEDYEKASFLRDLIRQKKDII